MGDEERSVLPEEESRQTVAKVLGSSTGNLKEANPQAFDLLVSLAQEGFLTHHQTRGGLDSVADKLLDTIPQDGGKNGD